MKVEETLNVGLHQRKATPPTDLGRVLGSTLANTLLKEVSALNTVGGVRQSEFASFLNDAYSDLISQSLSLPIHKAK
ncbi:hypothetical protein [Paracoccus aminophilus]|uniref:hypothetical protein n=1 Tax=Paracoccus aminophilus TaxID=34003 RepID=UPI0011DC7956|nr:hypothetical protein [Paracoccus aminophilus]